MKYTIKFKDGTQSLTDLTLVEASDFVMDNIEDRSNFELIEQVSEKPEKKKREKKPSVGQNMKQLKEEFITLLTPAQKEAVNKGQKVIKYSIELGFYLQVIHTDTQFFSAEKLKLERKENVISCFKDSIKNWSIELFEDTQNKMQSRHSVEDFTDKEFWEVINEFLNLK